MSTTFDQLVYSNVTPVVVSAWKKGGWKGRTAFDCRYVTSGDPDPNPGPLAVTIERTTSACWSVGGSVTAEAKLKNLLSRLFGELQISVEVNGNYQSCETRTDTLAGTVQSSQCFHNYGRVIWKDAKVSGEEDWAEAVTSWRSWCPGPKTYMWLSTNCGITTFTANADKLAEEVFQIAPPSIPCGGPNPADPQFDGKTKEQCCTPIDICNGSPNPPCCGIQAVP